MKNRLALLLTLFMLLAFSLAACSGDGRPFEEAVEIQQRQLVSLRLLPPERTQDAFFAVGQLVDFRIEATNSNGGTESISGLDRDWRISDSSVANIDRNGRLIGLRASEDPILIDVIIGGVQSTAYSLNISEATLQNVASINAVPTAQNPEPSSNTLDPCLPMEYFAIGNFGDSLRPLLQVDWDVNDLSAVDPLDEDADGELGIVRINGTGPGQVQLIASSSGLLASQDITIRNTLSTIDISPLDLGLQVGGSRDMVATGNYMDGVVTTPPLPGSDPATDAGSTMGGSELATVSNEPDSRGRVTARATGTITVTASCGEQTSGTGTLTINPRGAGGVLSFESEQRLNDADGENVTGQANWNLGEILSSSAAGNEAIISVGNGDFTGAKGFVRPLREGRQEVRARLDDDRSTLIVEVIQ